MDEQLSTDSQDAFPWHLGVFDAHCHPTDIMESVHEIYTMKASALIIMATRAQDQDLVSSVGEEMALHDTRATNSSNNAKVVPSFGWHPWFSHQIFDDVSTQNKSRKALDEEGKLKHYRSVLIPVPEDDSFVSSLPVPRLLSEYLKDTQSRLERFPFALVGEVGLDRAFRLPADWRLDDCASRDNRITPGGRDGRHLSPQRVRLDHQKKVLVEQLKLAGRMGRAVSCHGVQAHGAVYDTIRETWKGQEKKLPSKKEGKHKQIVTNSGSEGEPGLLATRKSSQFPPRLCLHSYSGPEDLVRQYLHPTVPVDIYFSFSILVNFSGSQSSKTERVIKIVPDDRILTESDMHTAGAGMDDHLEAITRKICDLKRWNLSDGVRRLADNWHDFTFGKR